MCEILWWLAKRFKKYLFIFKRKSPHFTHWFTRLTYARIDSVTVPIWLTFSSRQLQAFSSTALLMRLGLVTVRSSPTTWMSVLPVKLVQAAQSSWSKGSSMETTGSKEHADIPQWTVGAWSHGAEVLKHFGNLLYCRKNSQTTLRIVVQYLVLRPQQRVRVWTPLRGHFLKKRYMSTKIKTNNWKY